MESNKVDKGKFKSFTGLLCQALVMSLFFIVMEVFFHVSEDFEINVRFIYPVIFCLPVGFFFASIYQAFPKMVNCILSVVTMAAVALWTGVQICYAGVFDTYMDIAKLTMGKDVADNFGNEAKDAILVAVPQIIVLVLLVVIFAVIMFLLIKPQKNKLTFCLAGLIIMVILQLGCRGMLLIEGTSAYSPDSMYKQYPRILDNNMENFGIITSLRLELSDIIFGNESDSAAGGFRNEDMSFLMGETTTTTAFAATTTTSTTAATTTEATVIDNVPDGSETESSPEKTTDSVADDGNNQQIPVEVPVKTKNVLDIDFDTLIKNETNGALKNVHSYVNSLPGSNVNEYTGIFEGYNLIMICAESFTSYMISEELTPTLYKMANGGFSFKNFYGTFWSITTNGEYAFCTGLLPNTVGKVTELKENSTFLLSADKYLPYCMGNVFNDMGAATFAYHGNSSDYYERGITHPNMGYRVCRFMNGTYTDGVFSAAEKLVYTNGRLKPTSDKETALQTLKDYLNNKDENGNVKQFHAYYMTYSGHHPYYDVDDKDHSKNPMVFENRDKVDSLDCSSEVRAYLAANLEVENMVTAIIEALTEAGCLENTVIVLTNDHFPYGFTNDEKAAKELAALSGQTVDSVFGVYKNAFICYNAAMDKPVEVTTPCCTVDIIPTLLNLFGVDYDSRLLAGTDVLDTNSFHIAMLYNHSFITDKIKYNTSNGKITYLVDKNTVSQGYVDACINYVKNKFDMSLEIINNDYYRVIYDYLDK